MPKRSSLRPNRHSVIKRKTKLKPSDIDNIIRLLNKQDTQQSVMKLFVFFLERKVYKLKLDNDFLMYCFSCYFLLKKTYHLHAVVFDHPSFNILQEELSKNIKIYPGLQNNILQLIKIKTENDNPLNKICCLVLDEVALKPSTEKYEGEDKIGFEDDGIVKSILPARFATNIWLQNVSGTWQVPLAFFFTHKPCKAEDLKRYLTEAIKSLLDIGLNVTAVVTKMRSNFYELSQLLNISETNQTFTIDSHQVIFLFDVPQLMNITRNNLMKYKFKFDGKQTSWDDVKTYFLADDNKLTLGHVKPGKHQKTHPVFAIELLSNTVATKMQDCITSGILNQSAVGTAEFIDRIDKLFDVLNSSKKISMNDFASAFKGTKHQMSYLKKMMEFLKDLKVINRKNEDCTSKLKFINGWLITIQAFIKLWEVLKSEGYTCMMTRLINCEHSDNILNCPIKLLLLKNPTPMSFLKSFRSSFLTNYSYLADTFSDCLSVEEFSKKIYKRVPAVRHCLDGRNGDIGQASTSSGTRGIFNDHFCLNCFFSLIHD